MKIVKDSSLSGDFSSRWGNILRLSSEAFAIYFALRDNETMQNEFIDKLIQVEDERDGQMKLQFTPPHLKLTNLPSFTQTHVHQTFTVPMQGTISYNSRAYSVEELKAMTAATIVATGPISMGYYTLTNVGVDAQWNALGNYYITGPGEEKK